MAAWAEPVNSWIVALRIVSEPPVTRMVGEAVAVRSVTPTPIVT